MNIDEIYKHPDQVLHAIGELNWSNATVQSIFIGYEAHGILTVTLDCTGDCWGQGFGNRCLDVGSSFRNFVEGCLSLMSLKPEKKHIRVGREGNLFSQIVALRPIIDESPVFWPGTKADRFYVFDVGGEVARRGPG
ncbi:hypothetical protein LCGC14_1533150 [marine sediment metagenome]|uniref:Uncharacterized protein n=1 Tax=marine sediment metagenome TaxID=412755 RepID=A0A0F9LB82_9ZZZZ